MKVDLTGITSGERKLIHDFLEYLVENFPDLDKFKYEIKNQNSTTYITTFFGIPVPPHIMQRVEYQLLQERIDHLSPSSGIKLMWDSRILDDTLNFYWFYKFLDIEQHPIYLELNNLAKQFLHACLVENNSKYFYITVQNDKGIYFHHLCSFYRDKSPEYLLFLAGFLVYKEILSDYFFHPHSETTIQELYSYIESPEKFGLGLIENLLAHELLDSQSSVRYNIFISWSGEKGKKIAKKMRNFIEDVLPSAKCFFSPDDIEKGSLWNESVLTALSIANLGIIILTQEKKDSLWIHFEAGAIAKDIEKSRIYVCLFELNPNDVVGPLKNYQHTIFNKKDFRQLIKDLNHHLPFSISENQLKIDFAQRWLNFKKGI